MRRCGSVGGVCRQGGRVEEVDGMVQMGGRWSRLRCRSRAESWGRIER
jgi:hypothetical protein